MHPDVRTEPDQHLDKVEVARLADLFDDADDRLNDALHMTKHHWPDNDEQTG